MKTVDWHKVQEAAFNEGRECGGKVSRMIVAALKEYDAQLHGLPTRGTVTAFFASLNEKDEEG